MDRLFWVDIKDAKGVSYATFGIISRDGVIIDAAPIARWMVSKRLTEVKPWLLSKKAKVVEVKG